MFQSGGPDAAAIDALLARARRDVDDGSLPSCQVALAHDGKLVAAETYGAPATSRYVVFSVTKALTAASTWLLLGDGALRADTRVADVVPELQAPGMDAVTVEHLLTHTAGFPRAPMSPLEGANPERRRARFRAWRLDWPPGSRTEYHATSAHWVLADLVERTSGVDHRDFFRTRIADRLGLSALRLGVPPADQGDVLDVTVLAAREGGRALGSDVAETGETYLLRFNDPEVRAAGVPGAGAIGTAADVALLYQAFLHNPGGLWDAGVLADGTGRIRNELVDPLINVPANRTLGLVVAGADGSAMLRQFGRSVGPRAFGAAGVGGQTAWADPDTGLSFCYLTNGLEADVVASWTRSAKLATLAGRAVALPEVTA